VTTETTDDVPEAINAQATRGLRWSLLGNMAMKVASFGMAIVLARLLTPADFGDYAVALAATQFVMHINDVGLIAGTVQWRARWRRWRQPPRPSPSPSAS
jgi:PST family polysaccharide transporter